MIDTNSDPAAESATQCAQGNAMVCAQSLSGRMVGNGKPQEQE